MPLYTKLKRLLVGKPIASKYAHHERLGLLFGLPVFAADAISSVAYSSEEILRQLAHGGPDSLRYILPISVALAALLVIIAVSYFQTIHAYPQGGGTYLVSSENLGSKAGRIAGASLLIDYVLTVAVSISAGAAAIYSAFEEAKPYAVWISVIGVLVIMLANLRGARESGMLFAVPVYTFLGSLMLMLGIAVFRQMGHPPTTVTHEQLKEFQHYANWSLTFLLLRGFAASCAALTGTEAIADGVQAFKPPESRNAGLTLAVMVAIMLTLSFGMSWASHQYGLVPQQMEDKDYRTVLAMLGDRVFGDGTIMFLILQASTAAILFLAANTAFADFPRLSSFIAKDKFLPRQLMSVGDRLVFQNGIILLALVAILLIVVFKADTHMLIPLYALGVFISFTLSQAGMAVQWYKRTKAEGGLPLLNWRLYVSGIGALITATVTGILLYTKWEEHAYLIVFAIIALLVVFYKIRKYYDYLARVFEVAPEDEIRTVRSTVLLLIPRLHRGTLDAISYAKSLAKDCRALHVTQDPKSAQSLREFWIKHEIDIPLVILESPFRSLVEPVTDYIDQALVQEPDAFITVIVPQGVPPKWYQAALHSNLATALKMALSSKRRVVVTNVRYFLD